MSSTLLWPKPSNRLEPICSRSPLTKQHLISVSPQLCPTHSLPVAPLCATGCRMRTRSNQPMHMTLSPPSHCSLNAFPFRRPDCSPNAAFNAAEVSQEPSSPTPLHQQRQSCSLDRFLPPKGHQALNKHESHHHPDTPLQTVSGAF